jgi:Tol biopolymer transport system component
VASAPRLACAIALLTAATLAGAAQAGGPVFVPETTRVSVASNGAQANAPSGRPSLSASGRYVAFQSDASNLAGGPNVGMTEVYFRDREMAFGGTERISYAPSFGAANDASFRPSISADGRYIAFESLASNLVATDSNSASDVFVRDRETDTTERVSVSTAGVAGNGASDRPSISATGRYVVFRSAASNLVASDGNTVSDIFVHDRQTDTTERVSVGTSGMEGNASASDRPSISADGRFVAFMSDATNLVADDDNLVSDIFVRDRQAGTTERVSISSSGDEAAGQSVVSSISADGRYVAFDSFANNLVPGDTNQADVFVHDRQTDSTELVNPGVGGAEANGFSGEPSITADGGAVVFQSAASNLVAGDGNFATDVFLHDRDDDTTTRVSVATGGAQAEGGDSLSPAVSADGAVAAFDSDATNLIANDDNGFRDVFARQLIPSQYALTVVRDGAGEGTVTSTPAGIDCGIDCDESYLRDTEVTLTADAPPGSSFAGWSGDGCSGTDPCSVVMSQARTVTATFDSAPPETTITSGPEATGSAIAQYEFTADPAAGASFECRFDDGDFEPCSSPYTTPILTPGGHIFAVRASNAAGTDPTPATRELVVDHESPTAQLQINGDQVSPGVYSGTVTVGLATTDPAPSAGIRARYCRLDPPTPPTTFAAFNSLPCPASTAALGNHTVYGVANDNAGNESEIVSASFRIVQVPDTTITDGPRGEVYLKTPFWNFNASVAGSAFECRVDGGDWRACRSPFVARPLAPGGHSFEVRAISPDGAADPTPARADFSVAASGRWTDRCTIAPFLDLQSEFNDDTAPPSYCRILSSSPPDLRRCTTPDEKCTITGRTCPLWAECTLSLASNWSDADRRTNWRTSVLIRTVGGNTEILNDYTGDSPLVCETGPDGDRCRATHSGSGIHFPAVAGAEPLYPGFVEGLCFAGLPTRGPGLVERGPDSQRRLECEAVFTAKPVEVLAAQADGQFITLLVPGRGYVTITAAGRRVVSAGAAAHKPAFTATTATATGPGKVSIKPKLSKQSKRKLKRKGKLVLKVDSSYVSAEGGEPITATQKVTLLKAKKRR